VIATHEHKGDFKESSRFEICYRLLQSKDTAAYNLIIDGDEKRGHSKLKLVVGTFFRHNLGS